MIDFTDFDKLKEKIEPLFVPVAEEEAYCKKHKISRIKLDNGIPILGIERPVDDSRHTSIEFNIASGSYFDPPEKQGLHHLTEHLFNRKLRINNQDKTGINLNASTSSLMVRESIGGLTNYDYPSFGLWPLIAQTVEMLRSPVGQYTNPIEVLDGERAAIEKEIIERDSDQGSLAHNYVKELVLGNGNPYTASVRTLGSKESIAGISVEDCRKLAKQVIGAENLTVSFSTDTDGKTTRAIADRLSESLGDFPAVAKIKLDNPMIRELVSGEFQNGKKYSHDTGLRDGKCVVHLVWQTEADPSEANYWTRGSIFGESIHKSFRLLSRKHGWSYSAYFDIITPFWYRTGFIAELVVPKNTAASLYAFSEEVAQRFREEVLGRLDDNIAGQLLDEQKVLQLAQPVKQVSRLDFLVEGVEDYGGRILDPDRFREARLRAKTKDVLCWRDYLAETKPAVVVVGDVG